MSETKSNKVVWLSVLGVVAALVLLLVGSYISAYNYGNRAEQEIVAVWENNENILAQYGQKIQEAAQVPSMQRDDLIKIFTGTLGARYGKDGSKAAFQWIKEQNPNVDSSVYIKLQQMIEAGRDKFETGQTKLVDAKRSYKTALGTFWRGMWLRITGYPKIDLDKYKIISTDRASTAFEKGKEDGPLKLR